MRSWEPRVTPGSPTRVQPPSAASPTLEQGAGCDVQLLALEPARDAGTVGLSINLTCHHASSTNEILRH